MKADVLFYCPAIPELTIFIVHNDDCHFNPSRYPSTLRMLWIVLLLIILLLVWILLSPLEFKIDTRVPVIMIRWKAIGSATLLFEDEEWWLKIRVLFFAKKWNLIQMFFPGKKKRARINKNRRKKDVRKNKVIFKILKVLKTFRVVQWEVAFSADDYEKSAYWYWLNFFPLTRQHVHINFMDENYLVLVIKNRMGRVVYAFIK